MPWRCPACSTHVAHSDTLPHPNHVYRCPTCRLQMVFDPVTKKMQPWPPNDQDNGKNTGSAA
jgi:DNA-directed RNA polymerase subunit RPC12/RpoP